LTASFSFTKGKIFGGFSSLHPKNGEDGVLMESPKKLSLDFLLWKGTSSSSSYYSSFCVKRRIYVMKRSNMSWLINQCRDRHHCPEMRSVVAFEFPKTRSLRVPCPVPITSKFLFRILLIFYLFLCYFYFQSGTTNV
jgi:hypothetical protein